MSQSGSQKSKVNVSILLSQILSVKEKDAPYQYQENGEWKTMKMKTHLHNQVKCLPTQEYNSLVTELLEKLEEYHKTVQYWTNEIMKATVENSNVVQNFRGGQHTFTRQDISKINKLYLEALARSKYVFRSTKQSCKGSKGGAKGVNTVLYMSGPFQYYSYLLLTTLKQRQMTQVDNSNLHVTATNALNTLNPSTALLVKGHVKKLTAGSMFYVGAYLSNIDKVRRLLQNPQGLYSKEQMTQLKAMSEGQLRQLKDKYEGGSFAASSEMTTAFAVDAVPQGVPSGVFSVGADRLTVCINQLVPTMQKTNAKGVSVPQYEVRPAPVGERATLFQRMAAAQGFDSQRIPTNLVNRMLSLLDVSAKNIASYAAEYRPGFEANQAAKKDAALLQTMQNELLATSEIRKYYSLAYNKEAERIEASKKILTSAIAARKRADKPKK